MREQAPVPLAITGSVRFACFETDLEDFRLATNGGTLFLVRYDGKTYGITCHHVVQGFDIGALVVTDAGMGRRAARVNGMHLPINLRLDAEGTDIGDICIIDLEFEDAISCTDAYDLNLMPVASSEPAHRLIATGFLKEKSFIEPPNVFMSLCYLQLTDAGSASSDHSLRRGLASYADHGFASVAGMSGAPVYDITSNALTGMIVRGSLRSDGACTMHFIDIFDILQFLRAAHSGLAEVRYEKYRML